MNGHFEPGSLYTIRFTCPSQQHAIELSCESQTVVTVPRECPTCGIGLPDAYRIKLREIMNHARFNMQSAGETHSDIEIEIA